MSDWTLAALKTFGLFATSIPCRGMGGKLIFVAVSGGESKLPAPNRREILLPEQIKEDKGPRGMC